jgi:anaerobic selenocysteine-containing dehydrogenase
MMYERADHTLNIEKYFSQPFAMYAEPLVEPPNDVIEDWQFFWHLAKAMDIRLSLAGAPIDMAMMPTSSELLASMARDGRVPLDHVMGAPNGFLAPPRQTRVAPASALARGNRLELLPSDVAEELKAALAHVEEGSGMRLVVRRMREVMNSLGPDIERLPRQPFNPAFMAPADMLRLGIEADALVRLTTPHGSVTARVRSDPTLRAGTVALTHGWASGQEGAVNVNDITGNDGDMQTINAMPLLSAQRVRVEVVGLP